MAIDSHQWRAILAANIKGLALSAGHPDLLLRRAEIPLDDEWCMVRDDSKRVAKHHSIKGPVYDSYRVFDGLGLSLTVIDREQREGREKIVDLNEDWRCEAAAPYPCEYDLVIDPGTSEHCFNIAQAALNLAGCVKEGGVMSQALPMAMFNHGYYNVNPVWFLDFYESNGFRIEHFIIRHGDGVFPNPTRQRMIEVPDFSVCLVTARRVNVKPLVFPQQKI